MTVSLIHPSRPLPFGTVPPGYDVVPNTLPMRKPRRRAMTRKQLQVAFAARLGTFEPYTAA